MRRSGWYGIFVLFCIGLLGTLLLFRPGLTQARHDHRQRVRKELVRRLRVTDLCLFTEARYTRHPSQADLFSAFQDHPMALEHFPSGSMLRPPPFFSDRRSKAGEAAGQP